MKRNNIGAAGPVGLTGLTRAGFITVLEELAPAAEVEVVSGSATLNLTNLTATFTGESGTFTCPLPDGTAVNEEKELVFKGSSSSTATFRITGHFANFTSFVLSANALLGKFKWTGAKWVLMFGDIAPEP